jgi:hypothetical protein
MIIAVDFDGTLHDGEYPETGNPLPGAIEAMQRLSAEGHYIIIWTCRSRKSLVDMVNWLIEYGIPFNRINDNAPGCSKRYGYNSRKVYADVYIDDGQIGGLPAWREIYRRIGEGESLK